MCGLVTHDGFCESDWQKTVVESVSPGQGGDDLSGLLGPTWEYADRACWTDGNDCFSLTERQTGLCFCRILVSIHMQKNKLFTGRYICMLVLWYSVGGY